MITASVSETVSTAPRAEACRNILPTIESCAGCGACCLVVTSPPFRRVFDEDGEEAWERLRWRGAGAK